MTEHIEALPAIDVYELMTVGRNEIAHCSWLSPRGLLEGDGKFKWQFESTLAFTYELNRLLPPPRNEHYEGTIDLQLVRHPQPHKPNSWLHECQGCGGGYRFLYFVGGEWRCRVCHRLTYASQRVRGPMRRLRRAQEILATIADGRPKGMHERTYLALQAKSKRLQKLAENYDFRSPNKEVLLRCVFQWDRRQPIPKQGVPVPPLF